MEDAGNMAGISPVKLGLKSHFNFKCHKDVSCFTKCCRGINIVLTPYDIIRLKNRLGLSSDEFLTLYTKVRILEKTDIPMVTLRLLEDEADAPCPFVRETGCLVYEDRPTTCRYYPLGVGSLSHKEGADEDAFFFFVNEDHCRGFEEDKEWDVIEWRKDQGVDIHDEINAEWTDLIVRKRSFPKNIQFTEKTKQMFFLASYNIDRFRDFVFNSTFLDRYDIPRDTLQNIRRNEIELLKFGMRWLKWLLFKEGEFKLKSPNSQPSPSNLDPV
jgi:uncharacterized protein